MSADRTVPPSQENAATTGAPPASEQDPSERSRREAQLRQTDRTFHVLVQNVRDYAIMMLDTEGRVVAWNEGAARLKGYTQEQILGQHVSLFYPPEELRLNRPAQEMHTAEVEGRSEVEGYRVRHDGTRFWTNEIMTPIRDDAGKLIGFAKISRDLTERKRLDDALRESKERYRLLVENIYDYAILMLDAGGRIVTWNPGAARLFGFTEQEIIGQDAALLFTPEDRAAGQPEVELSTAAAVGRAEDERWQMRKDGSRFWASGVTSPLREPGGALRGFVKVARDLTERRQVEEERERLLEQEQKARWDAEKAMTIRDEFLAVVSHELRTPLTAILLWSKLMRSGRMLAGTVEQSQALEMIEQAAIAQQQLVEDLLDISRIISGKLRLYMREVDLAPLIQAAADAVRPMAEARNIAIQLSVEQGTATIRCDPDRLQQVVWNLVNNAVKFTPGGGRVVVALRRTQTRVEITVSDTGKGIGGAFLPHVFERFRQEDASLTRAHGGLGLGLAISRQLVELHGGTIRAASPGEGKGATFTVELPLTEPHIEPASPDRHPGIHPGSGPLFTPRPSLRGVRVLLAEDEPSTRSAVGLLLEQCAAEVTAVGSAAHAMVAFRDSVRTRRYDVLVSDIGMPGQDGYELVRQIRAAEKEWGETRKTPAVALTAYARDEDRAKALAAGFQAHLPKPVEPETLVNTVLDLAGIHSG